MGVPAASERQLESGDRMSQGEFHRRYLASPSLKKAELVEGVVYVPSPVSQRHADLHVRMSTWIGMYGARHPEVRFGDNGTVILDGDNEVQPDLYLWKASEAGPRMDGQYLRGAPQLVIEIAVSSVSYDLHDKLNAYRRSGVAEYIVWRVEDMTIDWFRLLDGRYVRIEPDASGVIESSVFPGLRLHMDKMLAGDLIGAIAALDVGAGS